MIGLPDCGDSACCFAETLTGMRTNGGCRCFKEIAHAYGDGPECDLLRLARRLAQERRALQKAVQQAHLSQGTLSYPDTTRET